MGSQWEDQGRTRGGSGEDQGRIRGGSVLRTLTDFYGLLRTLTDSYGLLRSFLSSSSQVPLKQSTRTLPYITPPMSGVDMAGIQDFQPDPLLSLSPCLAPSWDLRYPLIAGFYRRRKKTWEVFFFLSSYRVGESFPWSRPCSIP